MITSFQEIKTSTTIEIHKGHINSLLISTDGFDYNYPFSEKDTLTITYIAEKIENSKTLIYEIPISYFAKSNTNALINLGSVYLSQNGKLSVEFNHYKQEDTQYILDTSKLFELQTISSELTPFHFNIYDLHTNYETHTFKNSLNVQALKAERGFEVSSISFNKTLTPPKHSNKYTDIFISRTGIPEDVTITFQNPVELPTPTEPPTHTQVEGSQIVHDVIQHNPTLVSRSIYFPIGELGKEMVQNLLLSRKVMYNYENDNALQASAMIKAGFAYSSTYYNEIINTIS